ASVIVNASISGVKGQAGLGIYSATKGRSPQSSPDLDTRSERTWNSGNAISPGTTVTPGLDGLAGQGADLTRFYDYLGGLVPLGRNAQPLENRQCDLSSAQI
ncbi:MAG TPA: hypothetical protein VGM27_10185, partial [Acidobacteriaceae bacterium]